MFDIGPFGRHPFFGFVLELFTLDILGFHLISDSLLHGSKLSRVDGSLIEELLFIYTSNWSHLGNLLVHKWLREARLIKFVVAELSVTNQVDNDIVAELLPIKSSTVKRVVHVLKAIRINVENWSINSFGQVCCVY